MKPTKITDRNIEIIKRSIDFLSELSNIEHYWTLYKSSDKIISKLRENLESLWLIACTDISNEFLASCDNVDEIGGLSRLFKIRFKKILEWKSKSPIDIRISSLDNAVILNHLFSVIGINEGQLTENKQKEIYDLYLQNFLYLAMIKKKLLELFEEWEAMESSSNNKFIAEKLENKETNPRSKFRLSQNRKTDFIKIISAMYDTRMFETEDGYIANNKQELISEFGRLLGEDFTKYSVSLSQSKQVSK
ncbi:MAG: hypothetical protein WCJ03_00340 [Bacteroidales bacterium]